MQFKVRCIRIIHVQIILYLLVSPFSLMLTLATYVNQIIPSVVLNMI